MTNERYKSLRDARYAARCAMADSKAEDYAKGNDRLANFKEAAAALGTDPLDQAGTYFYKHVSAIFRYIRDKKVSSEPIEGRIQDAQEYLDIIGALIEEARNDTYDPAG